MEDLPRYLQTAPVISAAGDFATQETYTALRKNPCGAGLSRIRAREASAHRSFTGTHFARSYPAKRDSKNGA